MMIIRSLIKPTYTSDIPLRTYCTLQKLICGCVLIRGIVKKTRKGVLAFFFLFLGLCFLVGRRGEGIGTLRNGVNYCIQWGLWEGREKEEAGNCCVCVGVSHGGVHDGELIVLHFLLCGTGLCWVSYTGRVLYCFERVLAGSSFENQQGSSF